MAGTVAPNIVTDGLVLYLDAANTKSYPGSGTAWSDIASSKTGSLINGPTFSNTTSPGIIFDGTNDYASFEKIDLSQTSVVSVIFWCKLLSYPELANAGYLIFEVTTNFNSSTTGFLVSYSDNSNLSFLNQSPLLLALRGNAGYTIPAFNKTLVNDLKWHHYTCIFDKSQTTNNECTLYLDGILRTPSFYPDGLMSNNTNTFGNDPLFLGARSGGASGQGNVQIATFSMYNRTLTATEILQNYNTTKTRFGLT